MQVLMSMFKNGQIKIYYLNAHDFDFDTKSQNGQNKILY